MKNFQMIRDQLIEYITANSNGLWYTVGYRGQAKNAEDQRGSAMVKIVVVGFTPDRVGSTMTGEKRCRLSIDCEITVTEKSTMDISGLDNPSLTDAERAAILADIVDAEDGANLVMDEILGRLFDLFMGGDGEWFGMVENSLKISDRWGDDFRKDKVERYGSTVVLSGYASLSCTVIETPIGQFGLSAEGLYSEIDIQDGGGDPLHVDMEE